MPELLMKSYGNGEGKIGPWMRSSPICFIKTMVASLIPSFNGLRDTNNLQSKTSPM